MRQGGEERHLALRPERQLSHQHIGVLSQPGRQRGRLGAVGARAERQVLPHGQVAVQAQALRHVAEPAPALAVGRAAEQVDPAGGHRDEAQQHPDQRGLAGSVGPEQARDLTRLQLHRHVVHGRERAEAAGHVRGAQQGVRHDRTVLRRASDDDVLQVGLDGGGPGRQVRRGRRGRRVTAGPVLVPHSPPAPGPFGPDGLAGLGDVAREVGTHPVVGSLHEDAPAVEHDEVPGPFGLIEVGRRHEHGRARRRGLRHQPPQVDAAHRVDARGGLVEDQQVRPVHDRHNEAELAPHPSGQLCGESAGRGGERRPVQQFRAASGEFLAGQTVDARDEVDVLRDGQRGPAARRRGEVAQALPRRRMHRAGVQGHLAGQRAQQRGLARPVPADHGHDGSAGHLDGDVVERHGRPEADRGRTHRVRHVVPTVLALPPAAAGSVAAAGP